MAAPTLVIATGNLGKIREISALLSELGFTLKTLADFPDCPEVAEDGDTFEANAAKKAKAVAACTGLRGPGGRLRPGGGGPGGPARGVFGPVRGRPDRAGAAHGSGQLPETAGGDGGRPLGRSAGPGLSAAWWWPSREGGRPWPGGPARVLLTWHLRGDGGFGYDPVFWLPEYQQTMAEVGLEVKNRISHRAQALKQLKSTLAELVRREPTLFQPAKNIGT